MVRSRQAELVGQTYVGTIKWMSCNPVTGCTEWLAIAGMKIALNEVSVISECLPP